MIVTDHELFLKDVTDHNEIYKRLSILTSTLKKDSDISYTAAISSGTPALHVCWILLTGSGDFSNSYPLKLIKIKDPKFGDSQNIEVRLETSLPKIIRLKEELDSLKLNLIPVVMINIERGILTIGINEINLTSIEFCHYRYFAERKLQQKGSEKISDISMSISFMRTIFSYHEESFPNLDLNRDELRCMIKDGRELSITTFRSNISNVNKKIMQQLNNPVLGKYFQISVEGKRGAKFYGIKAPDSNIKVIKF